MATLRFKQINKVYDNHVQAVSNFNLDIEDGEFIVMVGPSGCGKTTILRMIAGLEQITTGELFIDDVRMNEVEPKDRDIAMVFQSSALYPHMNVYDNMAIGLKLKKLSREEIDLRVKHTAEILELSNVLDRKPGSLSGGQQQRVALGRAVVRNAKVLLFDEPLSSLDAKLRVQLRSEIIRLHERIGATTIYVTHDQTEAMTMASRIVVMKKGCIQQIGTPSEIYNQPANIFVAGFMGTPAANFLEGIYQDHKFSLHDCEIEIPNMYHQKMKPYHGKRVILGIRPEDLRIQAETDSIVHLKYKVEISELLGNECILHGTIGNQKLAVRAAYNVNIKTHDTVYVTMDVSKIHFFDVESENKII